MQQESLVWQYWVTSTMTVGILRGWGPRRETPDPVLGKRMTSELSPEDGPTSQERVRPCGEAQGARDGALGESVGTGAAAERRMESIWRPALEGLVYQPWNGGPDHIPI